MSDRMPEYMSNKMPHGRPNRMLDGMSEYMPDNMSAGGDHLKKVISCKGIFPLSNLRPRKIQCDINSVIHCYSTWFLPGHHIYLIPIHPKTDYPLVRSFPYPTWPNMRSWGSTCSRHGWPIPTRETWRSRKNTFGGSKSCELTDLSLPWAYLLSMLRISQNDIPVSALHHWPPLLECFRWPFFSLRRCSVRAKMRKSSLTNCARDT